MRTWMSTARDVTAHFMTAGEKAEEDKTKTKTLLLQPLATREIRR
jgi:hypothetical protein